MSRTPMPSSFDGDDSFYEEGRGQKLWRRLKEEPLIPLGCLLTVMALRGAQKAMKSGDRQRTNRMFRARIYAQAFTLVALCAGSAYWKTDREKRKEFEGMVAEKKAKEKSEAWIRELEARDAEEKELRQRREAKQKGMKLADHKAALAQAEEDAKAAAEEIKNDKGTWYGKLAWNNKENKENKEN